VRTVASPGDDGEVTFTFGDHLGSSSTVWQAGELGDTDPGVTSYQRYYPYGEPRDDYSPALPTDHTFTGQISDGLLDDGGTGLMYYRARYYDPQVGRFAAADTIVPDRSNPQDLNRYTYVGNNPINAIDPSGHVIVEGLDFSGSYYWWPELGVLVDTRPPPPIVSREEWGSREPGVGVEEWDCGAGWGMASGCHAIPQEGFYDPVSNPEGYAPYSLLETTAGQSLAETLFEVTIHHTGDSGTDDPIAIQNQHMAGGYWEVGYHFLIGRDGTIYEGRDIGVRGRHVYGKNTGRIGILVMGDFQPGPLWDLGGSEEPTPEQIEATTDLITWLDYQYGIDAVYGHRDFGSSDACPGDNLYPQVAVWDEMVQ
jgi:RHS repeat-associated protein